MDPTTPRHGADDRPSANRKALVITVASVVALLLIVALASRRVSRWCPCVQVLLPGIPNPPAQVAPDTAKLA